MPSLHFHPFYAWSLVDELSKAGILSSDVLRGYAESRLHRGRQEGWINEESRRSARWMFVFANHVVLPGEVDAPINFVPSLKGHIDWGSELLDPSERDMVRPQFDEALDPSWAARIAAVANRADISVTLAESVLDWWKRLREFESYAAAKIEPAEVWEAIDHSGFRAAFAEGKHTEHLLWNALAEKSRPGIVKILENDPLRERPKFAPWIDDVSHSASFARWADKLSAVGCPSLTRTHSSYTFKEPSDPTSYEAIVRFYFEKVRIPAPEDAAEALRYRDNDRIIEWRGKIESWSRNFDSGKIDLKSIKQEIDDASGYIEGARGIRTALNHISPWATFGLGALLELPFVEFPGKHAATIGLLTIEGLKRAASAIEASVAGSKPLRYGWLLVEPPKPSED